MTGIRLILQQKQELKLAQIITQSHMMSIPDEVLFLVANAIAFSPETVEPVLQRLKKDQPERNDEAKSVQRLYSLLSPSSSNPEGILRGGVIGAPDLSALGEQFGTYEILITPDVTYIGRDKNKPEIVFSDHLKGAPMEVGRLQLDLVQYPETSKLMAQLKRFDQWKRDVLKNAYVAIGEKQREYLGSLDKTDLHVFSQRDLAGKLNFNQSTMSRILSDRWVEIRSAKGEQQVIYTKDLLINIHQIKKFTYLHPLNEIFNEEFDTQKALSDQEITKRIRNGLARRTVAKYRKECEIPPTAERNRVYQKGTLDQPYKIF